jgi:HTH-type transcriptional regulator, sugar sensing transcriptional regulator
MLIDLTPFGFTTTESRVYGALLELGPTTGYGVARATRLARANAYGALDGLVTKGAATRSAARPARYRAADPEALIAQLAAAQGEALDRLGEALLKVGRAGEAETRAVTGARAVATLILHVVARAEHQVQGVLTPELVRQTLPAWRRAAERARVEVRLTGPLPEAEGLGFQTTDPARAPVLVVDDRQTIALEISGAAIEAVWSSHPAIARLARAALSA